LKDADQAVCKVRILSTHSTTILYDDRSAKRGALASQIAFNRELDLPHRLKSGALAAPPNS